VTRTCKEGEEGMVTTTGRKKAEKRSAMRCTGARCASASSTIVITRPKVISAPTWVTLRRILPTDDLAIHGDGFARTDNHEQHRSENESKGNYSAAQREDVSFGYLTSFLSYIVISL